MFTCRRVKKSIYGYFCNLLKDEGKNLIQTHIKDCPSCLREFNSNKTLFDLLSRKEISRPSAEFWQDFSEGLDKKLSATVQQQSPVSVIEKIRQVLAVFLQPSWVPVLATSFIVVITVSSILFFTGRQPSSNDHQAITLALLDEDIIEDLDILDELDIQQNTAIDENNPDDTLYDLEEMMDELDRWGQLS